METLTATEVRAMRLRAQGLAGPRARTAAEAVRRATAFQAQDAKACRLQLRVRSAGLTAAAMDGACGAAPGGPAVVRSWLMRGTLHAVPAQHLRWMNTLLGRRVADSQRGRRRQLGLDDETCARALPALEKALAGHPPMLRDTLVARLGEFGISLDPRSQAPAHLLLYAAGSGLICRGPEAAGDKATYVLREEWLHGVDGPDPTGDEALAELATRHAAAYGPVTEADFARWSGLPITQARRGLRAAAGDGRLTGMPGPGGESLWAKTSAAPPAGALPVRLTGHFDPYLLGYRDRDLLLAPPIASRIATGGGLLMPCVLVDGAVAATWRHEWRGKSRLEVRVEPLTGPLSAAARSGVDEEVADLGRFLGVGATWRPVERV